MTTKSVSFTSRKWSQLSLLALAELLAMSLWFSASAVLPQLKQAWSLGPAAQAWMTMSVQVGFVAGALCSALTNLADRVPGRYLFAVCALAGAGFNAAIVATDEPSTAILLRCATGFTLAGVYPPGMKLVATWSKRDRGLAIGMLVGALTLGSALPHLFNAVPLFDSGAATGGMPPWPPVLLTASALAAAAAMITALFVREGPHRTTAPPFDWRFALRAFTDRPLRLANFGYLGHMWELYAVWTWVPLFLLASYGAAGLSLAHARLAGFATVALGAVGSLIAGIIADRIGRTAVASASLVVSGACCLVVGLFYGNPWIATVICCIWGFAVVADSAQFSAAISELADPRYVGTSLTIQTSAGFLLTLGTIWLIPALLEPLGWRWVFSVLALGPLFGAVSMWRLRGLPQARQMASGQR